MADEENHINKNKFTVPFVCGCRNLGEALRRVTEGAAMLRTKGEAGTGNVVEAVRHARAVQREIRMLTTMDDDELYVAAKVGRYSCLIGLYECFLPTTYVSYSNSFHRFTHMFDAGHASTVRAGQGGSKDGQASGRELRRRWHRHSSRCGTYDAARYGRRFCWIWYFQV